MDKYIGYVKKLIGFRTVQGTPSEGAPFGQENADCLKYALSILEEAGCKTKNLDGYCGYGEYGEGELFGILSHLDVVPEGNGWSYPPYGGVIENGRLYGRGALDDKAPFVACLAAFERLKDEGAVFKRRLRFILGCNEESGWKCMEHYRKTEEMPSLGFSPDSDFPVVNVEKGLASFKITLSCPKSIIAINGGDRVNMVPDKASAQVEYSDSVQKRAKDLGVLCEGTRTLTLTAVGKGAHASTPSQGENAIYKLLYCLREEGDIGLLYKTFVVENGKSIGLELEDEKSGKLTYNIGVIKKEGDKLIVLLDIRFPVSYSIEDIASLLKKGLPFSTDTVSFHNPLYVPPTHPLVVNLLQSYDKVVGGKSKPLVVGGGTYARCLPVGVAFGPVFPNEDNQGIHCKDENISLSNFERLIEIYYTALKSLIV